MEKDCLTYPILQKYYSALSNLRELNINDDIFYNISKIDAFFAEFRNITFVMQKSFNTTELKKYYEIKRDELLLNEDMKWFLDKRNKVTHQEPFKLEKGVIVDVFLPNKTTTIIDDRLTIDNEFSFETICSILKDMLLGYSQYCDAFFSISLSFKENGNEVDIYKKIKYGIGIMNKFISSIISDYPCTCKKCQQLKKKIDECLANVLSKELEFIWDCSIENEEIVFGMNVSMTMGRKNLGVLPIDEIKTKIKGSFYEPENGQLFTLFQRFTSSYYIIYKMQQQHIMSNFMIIFDDGTFSEIPFLPTLKTTFYRMASKIAKIAREKNVIAVFYIGEYYFYPSDKIEQMQKPYNERIKIAEKTFLSSTMLCKNWTSMLTIEIDASMLDDNVYVAKQINNPSKEFHFHWLQPIYQSLHTN